MSILNQIAGTVPPHPTLESCLPPYTLVILLVPRTLMSSNSFDNNAFCRVCCAILFTRIKVYWFLHCYLLEFATLLRYYCYLLEFATHFDINTAIY